MPVAAIVFDMDGVLIDTEPIWEEVRRGYIDELGGRWLSDTQDRLMGMSTAEWAEYLSADLLDGKRTPDQVADDVITRMAARYADHLPLMPDAADTVRRLGATYPLALASSSPRRLIDVVLDHMGVRNLFRTTVSTEEVERGKPAPDGYLAAAAGLGIDPSACVAIEDSSNGLRSAAAAGMTVIAVPHPRYPPAADALALAAEVADGGLKSLTPELVAGLIP
ncbi:HAD family phosphatase [Nocardia yamanashiensis]|uniref:HAD family hydrolase n=1 Tax=Nocardia yamanashiensis TaxID=209247 RepID=UPI001E2EA4B9|nr:HAD family phosphatase [Nocardia yamanashiensis]UGT42077.1 HAD family phosphatase [Nocardia yamanashiensis]